jgi:hypothetical protein
MAGGLERAQARTGLPDVPHARAKDTADDHAVFVGGLATSEVRLERRSRLPGYCIVIRRRGHVAEPQARTATS